MKKRLGIIGGGQLGMMLTEAAKNLSKHISEITVLDPTKNCPASKVGAKQIIGNFDDRNAITRLANYSDIITYEIESGDSEVLKKLENDVIINPSPETLRIIQDKYLQKSFLKQNNLPIPHFEKIDSFEELQDKITNFGFPVLLKARKGAYDGRGNYKIDSKEEIKNAYDYLANKDLMLEKFVNFKKEISVIAARNTLGDIAAYPVVENIHEKNILRITIAPARISKDLAKLAQEIAYKTMDVFKGAGVFGIEMFLTKDDAILINEIAPRVHNSGHHTLQSSETSQFEQHLRAILGLKLGSVKLKHPTVMYNLLGPSTFTGEYKVTETNEPNVFLKMYGKAISKPYRKLGHFNLVGQNNESVDALLSKINILKQKIKIIPKNKFQS